MGIDFALDELYATGWSELDSSGCGRSSDGREFPKPERVRREFSAAGLDLAISRVDRYDCFQAHWSGTPGTAGGSVVGRTEAEAAIFALAQLRRQLTGSSRPRLATAGA
ncbi:MAG TPA: hypothetical protein VD963_06890 [Phycisphaerales bacterium]|nr:hypothetical protein [Phycisphaerales bacterium]